MYLHEPGEDIQSFTKEQLSNGNHNLHSFIVDKSESANLRQFGTILYNPKAASAANPNIVAPIPSHTPVQTIVPQSTTPAPSRSQNDSPKSSVTPAPAAPAAPPGLEQNIVAEPEPERVPWSMNSVRIPSLIEFLKWSPHQNWKNSLQWPHVDWVSFPEITATPATGPFVIFQFRSTWRGSQTATKTSSPIESADLTSSSSTCPSRQSFSFANLPIRSPKPSTSPVGFNSNGPLNPISPAPIKAVPVDSLFPQIIVHQILNPPKEGFSTSATSYNKQSATGIPVPSKSQQSSNNSSPASSYSPPSPAALKITISGKPIDTAVSSGNAQQLKKSTSNDQAAASYANKNLFDLFHQSSNNGTVDSEPVEMPSPSSASKSHNQLQSAPVKVIQTHGQPQTLADLERMAHEQKLDSHISNLEETMFRSRLEAESLETKLKMLFEASAQAKQKK